MSFKIKSNRFFIRFFLEISVIVLMTFVLSEIVLRLVLGNFGLPEMHAGNSDGRCIALTPNTSVEYTGWFRRVPVVHHDVNALGYRGPEVSFKKNPTYKRILMIGDSYTYGQGVNADQAISSWLERSLRERTGHKVEVLNFGCPGLNVEDNLEFYRKFASQWEHDLVIYNFFNNDFDKSVCDLAQKKIFLWLVKNIYTIRMITIFLNPHIPDERNLSSGEKSTLLSKVSEDFLRISRSLDASFAIVFLYGYGPPEDKMVPFIRQKAARNNFFIYDVGKECFGFYDDTFFIPGDGHYSAEGNRQVAICIADWLLRKGLL